MNKNLTTLLSTSNILQSSLKSVTFQKTKDLLNTESYFPFNALYGKVYCKQFNNEESACLLESVDWARNKCRCPHGQRKLSVIFNEMPVVSENKRAATHILKIFVLYCK